MHDQIMLVNAEDGPSAFRLFKIAGFGGIVLLSFLAFVFMALPRSFFIDGVASAIVQWAIARWPKIATDYDFLLHSNPNYAEMYVVFNVVSVITIVALMTLFIPPLIYFVKKGGKSIPEKFRTPGFLFGIPLGCIVIFWLIAILPTPFGRIPIWEMGLLYCALFWGVMQMLIAGTIVYFAKLLGNPKR